MLEPDRPGIAPEALELAKNLIMEFDQLEIKQQGLVSHILHINNILYIPLLITQSYSDKTNIKTMFSLCF